MFGRLRENEKLIFLPVPEPGVHRAEAFSAKDYADELGLDTSFDLGGGEGRPGLCPVLHYQDQLDTLSRKISAAAKTAIEESGMNMLYLVFGFLEWYESDDSKQPHLAPLVILPVTIERTAGKGRVVEAVLEYSGEDMETNLSLVEKMRRDFGLEVPPLEEDDTPESYFERFADILELKEALVHPAADHAGAPQLRQAPDVPGSRSEELACRPEHRKHPLVRELFEGSKNPEDRACGRVSH